MFLEKNINLILRAGGKRSLYVLSLLILLLTINQPGSGHGLALQESYWSPPQTIPTFDLSANPPVLIADQNRTVHAFSSQWIIEPDGSTSLVIVYNKWTLEDGWTNPIDIALLPGQETRLTDVYLDEKGIFHMTFWGGNNTGANIYYTQTPADLAADSRSWSVPVIIGENAGDPEGAAIVEGDQGAIYVVYNGRQMGNGLYVVNSKDNGENWSNPTPIFFAQSNEPNIAYLKVIKSKSGSMNAIWGVYNVGGQGRGIYYAKSVDGNEWSEPYLLAEALGGLGTQTPTIIQYNGDLFALFNLPPKIMMRRSNDDGQTWGDPSILFPRHIGVNGSLSTVVDGANNLHIFFGQRISGNPDIHGMWHSIWIDQRWKEPEAIESGPQVNDKTGNGSFDPYAADAVVSNGNVILVTWRSDPGLKGNGVWYSYKVLDILEQPVVSLPSQTSLQITKTSIPEANTGNNSNSISTEIPVDTHKLFDNQNGSSGLKNSLLIGVVLVLLLSFTWVIIRNNRSK